MSPEYVVTGTGGSQQTTSTERVQILAGIQGPAGRDGTVFNWRGEWDAGTQYAPDDAVYYAVDGALYICTSASLNEPPPENETKWDVLANPNVLWANHVTSIDGEHTNFQPRHGFPVSDTTLEYFTTLSYSDVTRQVDLSSDGSDATLEDPVNEFRFYNRGKRIVKTTVQQVTHPDVTGGYYIYFDENDVLVATTWEWTLELHNPVAYVYYNAVTSKGVLYEARHTGHRDPRLHEAIGNSIGAFLQEGFDLTDYTLSPGTPAAADVRWTQTEGEVRNVDISVLCPQVDATSLYTIASRSGASGDWVFEEDVTTPVAFTTTGFAEYNQFTGSTWQRTAGVTGNFINFFIFCLPALTPKRNVIIVPGQTAHASLVLAQAEIIESLSLDKSIAQAFAPSYRIITELNTAYTTEGKHRIVQVDQIFSERTGRVTQNNPTDHAALSGRTAAGSHPATAISNTPAGDISATTVQAAIDELDTEKYNEGDTIRAANGTTAAPGLSFTGHPQTGLYWDTTLSALGFSLVNARWMVLGTNVLNVPDLLQIGRPGVGDYVFLQMEQSNVLSQKNTTNKQTFKVWCWDDGSDKEWFEIRWDASEKVYLGTDYIVGIGTHAAPRAVVLMYGGNDRLTIGSTITTHASILPDTDGTLDLGSPSLKFANIYADNIASTPGGTIFLDDGSISAPSLAFTSDPDTGIFLDYTGFDPNINFTAAGPGGSFNARFTGFGFYPATTQTGYLGWDAWEWAEVHAVFHYAGTGSAGGPTFAHQNNKDSGLYFNGAGEVLLSYAGESQGELVGHEQPAAWRLYGGSIANPVGGERRIVGRTIQAGTVKYVEIFQEGGTSGVCNVYFGGTKVKTASFGSTAGSWAVYSTIDFDDDTHLKWETVEIEVVSVVGSPTEIAFQVQVQQAPSKVS